MNENRKIQSKKRYLLAFLIGTFIFAIVFFASYYLSYMQFQRISIFQTETAYDIFENKLNYILFEENICSEKAIGEVSNALRFQGRIIDDLERKLGKNDERVLFRKRFYTLVQLEHFEFIKAVNNECDFDFDFIFFFYSNEKKDIEESENLGVLLTSVYRRNENLLVYSFDLNLDSVLIENLKKKYNIEQPNTVIINDEISLISPGNIFEIENHLN